MCERGTLSDFTVRITCVRGCVGSRPLGYSMVCHPGVTDCQVCDRQSKGFESDENPANTDPVTRYITCRQVVGVSRHDLYQKIYLSLHIL